MVLIGTSHPIVDRLVKDRKVEIPSLQPGEGLIQVVRKAFGEKRAVIVTGGDQAGLDAALEQLAERLPHIWARGKDRTTLDDVEESDAAVLFRPVAGRSGRGRAVCLDRIGRELQGRPLESGDVSMHVDKAEPGLPDFVRREAASAHGVSSVVGHDRQPRRAESRQDLRRRFRRRVRGERVLGRLRGAGARRRFAVTVRCGSKCV